MTIPAGIELAATFAPDTPDVLGDRTQIHQVLMNLCANAWQAIIGSTGRISIETAGLVVSEGMRVLNLAPARYASLSVNDTGRGMDSSTIERIFDPFFTTKPPGEGTGLGLAVVDGIVKNHGGAIAVDSMPGRGTSFHLYFPAVGGPAVGQAPALAALALPRGRGQVVLYLDDEEALVALMLRMLERLGYQGRGFTRPADALAALRSEAADCDVLIADLNMPGTPGLEFARQALRLRPDLPVALTSGHITDDERARAHALGIHEILYKPNTLEQMAGALERLLSQVTAAAHLTARPA